MLFSDDMACCVSLKGIKSFSDESGEDRRMMSSNCRLSSQ